GADGRWTGGRAHLIQTGDYTDRGDGTRAVLDLLMALEPQARKAGGRAVSLLGNHEVMNLIGDTRDVTREIFATFADARSEARRQAAWSQYAALAAARVAKGASVPPVYGQTRDAWLTTHPPGYVEYREAFAPNGKYGRWLRDKDLVMRHEGSIFMHAGFDPDTAPPEFDDMNTLLRTEVRRLDRFRDLLVAQKLALPFFTLQEILQVASNEIGTANALIAAAQAEGKQPDRSKLNTALLLEAQEILKIDTWLVVAGDGPLWYRGLATLPDDATGGPFAALLQRYDADRFVTGHTPQQNRRINARFGGRAILIDTGMLSYYKGRASALQIEGDVLTAIYEDGTVPLDGPAKAGHHIDYAERNQATVWRSPSSSVTVGR
ncbi:MAG: metallophosphoesterase, partial [Acidobacteriota bacterium]|nr:metallophosphoesterase [Acidobacteriota bacterium]